MQLQNVPVLVPLFAAAACSALLCDLLIRFSDRLPFQKLPVPGRWHRKPTPDSGGIAIFAAAAVVYAMVLPGRYPAVALGSALFWSLGMVDDRFRLAVRSKLILQVLIATGVGLAGMSFDFAPWRAVNLVYTIFWLVGITNALNVIDNMDGLAAGASIIIAGFRAVLLWTHGYSDETLFCSLLAAAVAGFLIFNFHPARIFMGNSGSMFLGFTLAALTVVSPLPHKRSVAGALFYPALTFAYPIFDTALVSLLRRAGGRPISAGGLDHSSHRLASVGLNDRLIVGILWVFTAAGGFVGLVLHWLPLAAAAMVALLAAFASLFGLYLAKLPPGCRVEPTAPVLPQ
jgi:UDP-GlcNAc:undecaprenyl-phosphate GlcNAc-1-phosphate transferase